MPSLIGHFAYIIAKLWRIMVSEFFSSKSNDLMHITKIVAYNFWGQGGEFSERKSFLFFFLARALTILGKMAKATKLSLNYQGPLFESECCSHLNPKLTACAFVCVFITRFRWSNVVICKNWSHKLNRCCTIFPLDLSQITGTYFQ